MSGPPMSPRHIKKVNRLLEERFAKKGNRKERRARAAQTRRKKGESVH